MIWGVVVGVDFGRDLLGEREEVQQSVGATLQWGRKALLKEVRAALLQVGRRDSAKAASELNRSRRFVAHPRVGFADAVVEALGPLTSQTFSINAPEPAEVAETRGPCACAHFENKQGHTVLYQHNGAEVPQIHNVSTEVEPNADDSVAMPVEFANAVAGAHPRDTAERIVSGVVLLSHCVHKVCSSPGTSRVVGSAFAGSPGPVCFVIARSIC